MKAFGYLIFSFAAMLLHGYYVNARDDLLSALLLFAQLTLGLAFAFGALDWYKWARTPPPAEKPY